MGLKDKLLITAIFIVFAGFVLVAVAAASTIGFWPLILVSAVIWWLVWIAPDVWRSFLKGGDLLASWILDWLKAAAVAPLLAVSQVIGALIVGTTIYVIISGIITGFLAE